MTNGKQLAQSEPNHARRPMRACLAVVVLPFWEMSRCRAQVPVLVDPSSGLRLLVVGENTLPTLKSAPFGIAFTVAVGFRN